VLVRGFAHQVEVVRLRRVVHDAEAEALRAVAQRLAHDAVFRVAAQARQSFEKSQRHVQRMSARVSFACDVRDAAA
jgi:phosphoribosylformylglycinamidine (FGAM) synthase PurS component